MYVRWITDLHVSKMEQSVNPDILAAHDSTLAQAVALHKIPHTKKSYPSSHPHSDSASASNSRSDFKSNPQNIHSDDSRQSGEREKRSGGRSNGKERGEALWVKFGSGRERDAFVEAVERVQRLADEEVDSD